MTKDRFNILIIPGMTLVDFVAQFLEEIIKSNSYDIIHKQIQHLAFIVNTGRRGTEEDVTTLISEQGKVMVGQINIFWLRQGAQGVTLSVCLSVRDKLV